MAIAGPKPNDPVSAYSRAVIWAIAFTAPRHSWVCWYGLQQKSTERALLVQEPQHHAVVVLGFIEEDEV